MNVRTDFADELLVKKSKEYTKKVSNYRCVKKTNIEILTDDNSFNKEKGKYISLEFIIKLYLQFIFLGGTI